MPEFLDTNILVRHYTQDHADHARRARTLLQAAEDGTLILVTCEGVIVETVQVLESKTLYNVPRAEIQAYLSTIIALRGLRLEHKRVYLRALELYVTLPRLSFVDALQVAHMERLGITTIATFDQGFDRIPGITRHEP